MTRCAARGGDRGAVGDVPGRRRVPGGHQRPTSGSACPPGSLDLVRESIRRGDQARLRALRPGPERDRPRDGTPSRMLEINGDTPTGLVETGVAQWRWIEDVMPGTDQWNSVHDRLVQRWRDLAESGALDGDRVHFLSPGPRPRRRRRRDGDDRPLHAGLRRAGRAAGGRPAHRRGRLEPGPRGVRGPRRAARSATPSSSTRGRTCSASGSAGCCSTAPRPAR